MNPLRAELVKTLGMRERWPDCQKKTVVLISPVKCACCEYTHSPMKNISIQRGSIVVDFISSIDSKAVTLKMRTSEINA